jgi:hypothetical protein
MPCCRLGCDALLPAAACGGLDLLEVSTRARMRDTIGCHTAARSTPPNHFVIGDFQAPTNMELPILPILTQIWTDFEGPIWTDVGWPSKWVRFTRKGVTYCGVTHYASCSGVACPKGSHPSLNATGSDCFSSVWA